MKASIVAQIRFLASNLELDIGGNHLIKNIKALAWASCCFEGEEADSWGALASELLEKELDEQILPDGVHFERSHSYHLQVFADLLELLELVQPGSLRDALEQRVHSMAQVARDLTHPDGGCSLFNDSGLHSSYLSEDCLRVYTAATGRKVLARNLFSMASAGYFGVRSGGNFLVIDCGDIAPDHLPAHGHGDALSFEWSVDHRRIIVDAGVAEYEPGDLRDYSRSTRAHNTVTLDDEDQCEFYSSFRMGRRPQVELHRIKADVDSIFLEGSHTGFQHLEGSPVHFRRIVASATNVDVTDTIEGGAGQQALSRLLLHPDAKVHNRDGKVTIVRGSTLVRLITTSRIHVGRGYWCPDFGVCLPTQQIVLDYGQAPCIGGFVLEAVPSRERKPHPATLMRSPVAPLNS